MKTLRGSTIAKVFTILIFTLLVVATLLSAGVAAVLGYAGLYTDAPYMTKQTVLESATRDIAADAMEAYTNGGDIDKLFAETNVRFEIKDEKGKLLFSNYSGEPSICTAQFEQTGEDKNTITAYTLEELQYEDRVSNCSKLFDTAYSMRYALIIFALVGTVLSALLFVFLMCAAGHRNGTELVQANFVDKIPFDLFSAIIIGFLVLLTAMIVETGYAAVVLAIPASILAILLLLLFFMSLATRLKLGGLIKGCLCYKIVEFCLKWSCKIIMFLFNTVKRFFGFIGRALSSIPFLGKFALPLAVVLIVEFIFILSVNSKGSEVFWWFVERAALTLLVLYAVGCMDKLYKGGKMLANGNSSYKVPTKHMKGVFLEHAENLNDMSSSVSRAVEAQMKSEHFRTELITNVSHDIKTPLTSIINYVDLLEKEPSTNEKSQEYIEVLTRQSAKLKKLIDDLLEASKASAGTLPVNFERCDVGVLLSQALGEYSERMEKAKLELVLTKPDAEVPIMADGRHMWRVLDNLMSNICKYSQPGTRVYIDLSRDSINAVMRFKNTSAAQLNVSGEELRQRFVRGDSSRNTEGSGLGLSIAESLVKLQNGTLELDVDGDLFKLTLRFPTV